MDRGVITSTRNSRVQEARRLRLAKHRNEAHRVLVEGTKHICDAIDAGGRLLRLFVSADSAGTRTVSELIERAAGQNTEVLLCSNRVAASLSSVQTNQGVIAVFSAPYADAAEVAEQMAQGSIGFLLDRLQDPGNLGAIVRTASACGACGVVVSSGTVDPLNDKVIRSSASALFSVGVARVACLADYIRGLRSAGVRVVAMEAHRGRAYFDECLTGPLALLAGNEGAGIADELLCLSDAVVSIPMPGRAESLNAAVAVSIVAYEAVRQRMRL